MAEEEEGTNNAPASMDEQGAAGVGALAALAQQQQELHAPHQPLPASWDSDSDLDPERAPVHMEEAAATEVGTLAAEQQQEPHNPRQPLPASWDSDSDLDAAGAAMLDKAENSRPYRAPLSLGQLAVAEMAALTAEEGGGFEWGWAG